MRRYCVLDYSLATEVGTKAQAAYFCEAAAYFLRVSCHLWKIIKERRTQGGAIKLSLAIVSLLDLPGDLNCRVMILTRALEY